jgi:hypothetical protein
MDPAPAPERAEPEPSGATSSAELFSLREFDCD